MVALSGWKECQNGTPCSGSYQPEKALLNFGPDRYISSAFSVLENGTADVPEILRMWLVAFVFFLFCRQFGFTLHQAMFH